TDVKRALRRAWFRLAPVADGYSLFQVPLRHGARRVLTRRFARAARRAGVPVHGWVVDDPAEMRMLLDWGVTGIITDRPDLAQDVLAAWIAGGDGPSSSAGAAAGSVAPREHGLVGHTVR